MKKNQMAKLGFTLFSAGLISANVMADDANLKATLEKEVQELKERQLGREELYAKLKEDAKIRWHRDEYKKLLKRFDEYYNKLEQKIADKEQQIVELTKLLEVLN